MKSGSPGFSGVKMADEEKPPLSSANEVTGLGAGELCFGLRPRGRAGCETTPATSNPLPGAREASNSPSSTTVAILQKVKKTCDNWLHGKRRTGAIDEAAIAASLVLHIPKRLWLPRVCPRTQRAGETRHLWQSQLEFGKIENQHIVVCILQSYGMQSTGVARPQIAWGTTGPVRSPCMRGRLTRPRRQTPEPSAVIHAMLYNRIFVPCTVDVFSILSPPTPSFRCSPSVVIRSHRTAVPLPATRGSHELWLQLLIEARGPLRSRRGARQSLRRSSLADQ